MPIKTGIIFGNGASIDELPDAFMDWAKEQTTFGVNRAPICTRFKKARFRPTAYCSRDAYQKRDYEIWVGLDKWRDRVDMYLGDNWMLPHRDVPLHPAKFTTEWAALLAHFEYGCDDIVVVGCESKGLHHKCTADYPEYTTWDDSEITRLCHKEAWKIACCRMPGVRMRIWPEWSLLHPDPIEEVFDMNIAG